MANKVHGSVSAGEKLGSGLDFYTISTALDITGGVFGSDAQNRLDRLVEIVALNGQPVLLGTPVSDGAGTPTYTVKLAIEHAGSWATADALKAAIIAHQTAGMGFTTSNLTVLVNPNL